MASNSEAIGILFGVLGGGDVNGESGNRIKTELSQIVRSINNDPDLLQLKFKVGDGVDLGAVSKNIGSVAAAEKQYAKAANERTKSVNDQEAAYKRLRDAIKEYNEASSHAYKVSRSNRRKVAGSDKTIPGISLDADENFKKTDLGGPAKGYNKKEVEAAITRLVSARSELKKVFNDKNIKSLIDPNDYDYFEKERKHAFDKYQKHKQIDFFDVSDKKNAALVAQTDDIAEAFKSARESAEEYINELKRVSSLTGDDRIKVGPNKQLISIGTPESEETLGKVNFRKDLYEQSIRSAIFPDSGITKILEDEYSGQIEEVKMGMDGYFTEEEKSIKNQQRLYNEAIQKLKEYIAEVAKIDELLNVSTDPYAKDNTKFNTDAGEWYTVSDDKNIQDWVYNVHKAEEALKSATSAEKKFLLAGKKWEDLSRYIDAAWENLYGFSNASDKLSVSDKSSASPLMKVGGGTYEDFFDGGDNKNSVQDIVSEASKISGSKIARLYNEIDWVNGDPQKDTDKKEKEIKTIKALIKSAEKEVQRFYDVLVDDGKFDEADKFAAHINGTVKKIVIERKKLTDEAKKEASQGTAPTTTGTTIAPEAEAAKVQEEAKAAEEASEKIVKSKKKTKKAIKEESAAKDENTKKTDENASSTEQILKATEEVQKQLEISKKKEADLEAKLAELNEAEKKEAAAAKESAAAEKETTKAKEKSAKSRKKSASATKEETEAKKEEVKVSSEAATAEKAVEDSKEKATKSRKKSSEAAKKESEAKKEEAKVSTETVSSEKIAEEAKEKTTKSRKKSSDATKKETEAKKEEAKVSTEAANAEKASDETKKKSTKSKKESAKATKENTDAKKEDIKATKEAAEAEAKLDKTVKAAEKTKKKRHTKRDDRISLNNVKGDPDLEYGDTTYYGTRDESKLMSMFGAEGVNTIYTTRMNLIKEYYNLLQQIHKEQNRDGSNISGDEESGFSTTSNASQKLIERFNLVSKLHKEQQKYFEFASQNVKKTVLTEAQLIKLLIKESELRNGMEVSDPLQERSAKSKWYGLADNARTYVNRVEYAASRDSTAAKMLKGLKDMANNTSDDAYKDYDKLKDKLAEARAYIDDAGLSTETWGQKMMKTFGTRLRSLIAGLGLGNVAKYLRDIYNNVVQIDSAMTQLKIVTGASDYQMNRFLTNSIKLAKELSSSVTEIMGSIETFSRLGYGITDATTLAEYATIMSNVAGVSTDEATKGLTSIIKGYSLNVEDTEHVADVLIQVGQKYAVSASELMEAYTKAGSALSATGTSFEKSAALIAAGNAAVQDASVVGTALKTISARIRGSKTDLEEMGESVDDLANGFSKYAEEIEQLTGFNIMVEGTTDTFKDLYNIMGGLAERWDTLSDTQKARVSEILGGTRQLQVVSSILNSFGDASGAYSDALNSAGTAANANEIYVDSIDGKLKQLKASFQELSQSVLDSGLVKFVISAANAIINVFTFLNKYTLGLATTLPTVLAGILAFSGAIETLKKSETAIAFVKGLTNAIKSLTTSTEAATVATEGLNAASKTNVYILLATVIISVAYALYNLAKNADTAEDRFQKYSETIDSTESEIDRLNQKIAENNSLLEKVNNTADDDVYITRLKNENLELEREIELQKILNKEASQKAAKEAQDILSKKERYLEETLLQSGTMEELIANDKFWDRAWNDGFFEDMSVYSKVSRLIYELERGDTLSEDKSGALSDYMKTILKYREYLDLSNEDQNELYNNLGILIDKYNNIYRTGSNAMDAIANATENAKIELKGLLSILEDMSSSYDLLEDIIKDMDKYGILSAGTLKNLLSSDNKDLLDFLKESGALMGDVSQGYMVASDAIDKYIASQVEAAIAAAKLAKTESEKEIAIQNLKDLQTVIYTLLVTENDIETDRLNNQLDKYKELLDLRKELLQSYLEESKYQKELESKQQNVAKLRTKLSLALLDTSAAGQKKAAQLSEELANAESELEDYTLEHAINDVIEKIDNDYDDYKAMIEDQITSLKASISSASSDISSAIINAMNKLADAIDNPNFKGEEDLIEAVSEDGVVLVDGQPIKKKSSAGGAAGGLLHVRRASYGAVSGIAEDKIGGIYPSSYVTPTEMINKMCDSIKNSAPTTEFNSPLVSIVCESITKESVPDVDKIVNQAVSEVKRIFSSGLTRVGYK